MINICYQAIRISYYSSNTHAPKSANILFEIKTQNKFKSYEAKHTYIDIYAAFKSRLIMCDFHITVNVNASCKSIHHLVLFIVMVFPAQKQDIINDINIEIIFRFATYFQIRQFLNQCLVVFVPCD